MAESNDIILIEDSTDDEKEKNNLDCPICLQLCIHPTRLPCGHIFCFLCVKGVANKNRRCALCRREIPTECLEHPELVRGTRDLNATNSNEFRWFYEGRNGWWQYDDRTSQDIEDAFLKKEKTCSILVAGHLYIVDFEAMTQLRQDDPSRRRRVKRDLASIPKKGVAGLRIDSNNTVVTDITPTTSESVITSEPIPTPGNPNAPSTITATEAALRIATHIIDSTLAHSDDYQSSDDATGRDISQEIFDDSAGDLLEGIRSLTLRNILDSSDSENENIF